MDLSPTAQVLRSGYLQRRAMFYRASDGMEMTSLHPRWDGGVDSRGARHKGIWQKLGDYADSNRIDPLVWLGVLFAAEPVLGRIPLPSDFQNDVVLAKLRNAAADAKIDDEVAVRAGRLEVLREIAMRKQTSKLDGKELERGVIADSTLAFSALDRYFAAYVAEHYDLAAVFAVAAKAQYLRKREVYDRVFSSPKAAAAFRALLEVRP